MLWEELSILFLPGIDMSSIACKNSNIVIVMSFETIPTTTASRSLSKLPRGIQNDQVHFDVDLILFCQISVTIEICNFFSTCFIFHSLGAMVTLPRYPDPVYFWRGSLSDLCTLHLARGHFFILLHFYALCYFAFLFTFTLDVDTCASFLGISSTTVKLLVTKNFSRLEWKFWKSVW